MIDGDEKVSKKAREILTRFERLKEDRANFEELWKECEWAVAPVIQKWDDEKPKDKYIIPDRETNQPTNFLNTCVTGLAGYAVAPMIAWFRIRLADDNLMKEDGVPQWLQECEKTLLRTFQRCGFYKKSIRWIELAVTYGHGAMLIEEMSNTDAPIRFHVPEAHEVYFDNNDIGETEVVYRYYWTDVENIITRYGRKAMHPKLLEKYDKYVESQDSNSLQVSPAVMDMKILHAVYLRRAGTPDKTETVANKKWSSVILDIDNKHIIRESGYDDFPYAIFFWENTGKPYGISPTMKGLNDIKIFQQAYHEYLIALQQTTNPTKFVFDQGKRHWNFNPGAINQVLSPESVPQVLPTGANFPSMIEIMQQLEGYVKNWYHVDFFIMLRQQSGLASMTATAISAMQAEQIALLAPMVSNLQDGLSKIIQRTFDILAKKKLLPPMPYALQELGGSLKVEFIGVLANAQKALYEYMGLQDAMTFAGGFAEFGKIDPSWTRAINWLKPEMLFKLMLESRGIPANVMRTEEEYNKVLAGIEEQEAQVAAQSAAATRDQALLQNVKSLNQPVQEGSMLADWLSPKGLKKG